MPTKQPAKQPLPTRPKPGGPEPAGPGTAKPPLTKKARGRRRRRRILVSVLVVFALLIAWPIGLLIWANGQLNHVDALSGAANTPGTTYLIAGSDSRSGTGINDGTQGARTDTIMLLDVPTSGPAALISIPRDSYVSIPGYGKNKINAAYSFGGPKLLVQTVEQLTGITVDHYVEIGFDGVAEVVDAIGGVELCYNSDVNDPKSGLVWQAGCHQADGQTALAFSRMRYSDPKGDIGRTERQQQVIQAIAKKIATPSVLLNPVTQVKLIKAGTNAITVDNSTNIMAIARMALDFKKATGSGGITGTPPIADPGYDVSGVGSTVLLGDSTQDFFSQIEAGTMSPGTVGGLPSP